MDTTAITIKTAAQRTLATLIQAVAAWTVLIAGAYATGNLTANLAAATAVGTIAVPVATAVQRFAQAWQQSRA